MQTIDLHTIKTIFKERNPDSHKGTHGHLFLVAGSQSKMGAAIISAKSALRAGVGLLTVNIPKKERAAVFTAIPEAMVAFREDQIEFEKFNTVAVGPGLGTTASAERKVEFLMENVKTPIVFDADALTILAQKLGLLNKIPKHSILTPHPKEFDRLFGNHTTTEGRINTAIQKAAEWQCVIVLKGSQTLVTNGSESYLNSTGNSGLAKGGSGDALTGIIAALLAQGYEPLNAAILGVFLHGLAADITLETQSPESMLITDVIANLGQAFQYTQK